MYRLPLRTLRNIDDVIARYVHALFIVGKLGPAHNVLVMTLSCLYTPPL